MFKKLFSVVTIVVGLAASTFASSITADTVNLLDSSKALFSIDVGNGTLTIAPRLSKDSVITTWSMDSGGWNNTWVSLVCAVGTSLKGADSIRIVYRNNNVSGFSLRLTLRDKTVWQSPFFLNDTAKLSGVTFKLDSLSFPQQWATGGVFNADSIKSVSLVNNTNPTTLTSTGASGVFKIYQFFIKTKSSVDVKQFTNAPIPSVAPIQLASNGFVASQAGKYEVSVFKSNGELVRDLTGLYSAGFNQLNFYGLGWGIFVVRINGNGGIAVNKLIIRK